MATQQGNIPVPDPSILTTEQINRTVEQIRVEFAAAITATSRLRDAQFETLRVRLDGMDKAAAVLSEGLSRTPSVLDRETARLEKLFAERFDSVALQFRERDVRSDQDKFAASTAINAALSALKEMIALQNTANAAAITKSEASTIKQMDGILALLASNNNALNDKIAVINGRLDRGEGGDKAHSSTTVTTIAIAAVIVSLFVGIFSIMNNRSSMIPTPATIVSPAVVPVGPR